MSDVSCATCKLADWKRTSNGRLHPDKNGRCTWKFPVFPIPLAISFGYGRDGQAPIMPTYPYISRDARWLKVDCPAWQSI